MAAQDPQPGLPRPASGEGEHVEPNCFTGGLLASAGDAPTQEGPQPEEALRKWEEKLLRGCPASFEGIAVHDNGRILDANRTLAKMVGYELSELIGMEAPRLVAPEWRDFTLQKRLAGCEEPYEAVALRKDGSTFLAELRGRVIPFDGRTVRVVAIRDITELKRAEETLRESEKRFRTSVENMLDCFGIYSAIRDESGRIVDFRIEYVNGAACANNLMSEDEQVGRRLLELLPAHRETGLFDEYCQVVETGMPLVKESLFYEDDYREQRLLRAFDIRAAKLGDGFAAAWRDITERKRAEEALAYQAQLLASVNDAIISTDEQFILRSWNPAAERIYGWKAEEVLGRPAPEVLRTEYPGAERSAVIGAAVETGNFHGEVVQYRKDGTAIQVESKVIALRDDCERTTGYVGVNRDITQRKRAEEALRQAEGRYRFLFEQAPAMYVITRNDDGAPIITDCNELFLVTLGYPRAEALGRPLADFYTPPSRTRLLEHGGYQRALEGRFVVEGRRLVTRDGRVVETVLRAVPELDDGGRTIGTRAMYLNITELRRAEEALRESERRYRLLAENVTDVIWMMDRNLRTTYISPSVTRLRGYSVEEAMGHTLEEVLTPASLDVAVKVLAEELAEEETGEKDPSRSRTLELEHICKDGSTLWAEVRMTSLRDEHGRIVEILGVTRDISERKRAQEALQNLATLPGENPNPIIRVARNGTVIFANQSSGPLLQLWGCAEGASLPPEPYQQVESALTAGKLVTGETVCGDRTFLVICAPIAERDYVNIYGVDITERKGAEEALRESESRYRLLAENASDMIWTVDTNLRFTYVSPSVARIRGYSAAEVMAQTLEEVLTLPSLKLARRAFAEELAAESTGRSDPSRSRTLELEHICKDGSTVWAEVRMTALRDESGRIAEILGVSRDIGERRRAQLALEESERRYRLLAENATDVIWTRDMNLRQTYASPSVTRMLGYSVDEVMAQTMEEALTPASLEVARKVLAEELAVEETEGKDLSRSRTLELEHICKDGSTVWAEVRMTALRDETGRVAEILGVSRDITERRRAEEALRRERDRAQKYLDVAEVILVAINRDEEVTLINRKGCRVLGYNEEDIVGKNWFDSFLPARTREEVRPVFQSLMAGEIEPSEYYENPVLAESGEERLIAWYNTLLTDEAGGIAATLSSGEDITERRRAEEALQEAREELESRVEHRMRRGSAYGLTFRELTVLHLVVAGKSDKEIGAVLGISNLTASKHLANILRKMDAASRTEAGVRAVREGLLD